MKTNAKSIVAAAIAAALTAGTVAGTALASPTHPHIGTDENGASVAAMPWHEKDGLAGRVWVDGVGWVGCLL
jgi:hypothetical protein